MNIKKIILIIVAAVFVLILIGGAIGAYFIFKPKQSEATEDNTPKIVAPVSFIPLDPFVVNLKGNKEIQPSNKKAERFAQISITLALTDAKVDPQIKQQLPLLRDRILRLIAGKTPEELLTQEGKDILASEIMKALKDNLPEEQSKAIKEVLFNGFIVQ